MTYVKDQTSSELKAHMKRMQAMPGWHEPLCDRLWQEVQALQRENEALKHDIARHVAIASEEATRADKTMALLAELAAIKRYDPNGSRGWARNYLTLNIPATLLERVDASLQVKGK